MRGCRPLTTQEVDRTVEAFLGRFSVRDRALFVLGVRTGFRVSELLSLRIRDVWQHGRVVDRVTVRRGAMKRKLQGRTVVLHPQAREALSAWIRVLRSSYVAGSDSPLFRSRKGANSPDGRAIGKRQALRVLRRAFELAELGGQLGTHAMRKTFAAKVHEALGGDIRKTAAALGHRNINSTASYLSFEGSEIDDAILGM